MTRTQRSIASLTSSLLLQTITVGVGVVSTPLLLEWLGDERFGAFRSMSDWLSYLTWLEMGLGIAITPIIAIAVAQGNYHSIRLALVISIRKYLKTLVLIIVAGTALGSVASQLVPVRNGLSDELQQGYWLGLANLFLIPLTPFRVLNDASQRSYFTNFLYIIQALCITTLTLLLAKWQLGIPGQFLAVLAGGIIFNLGISWRGLRSYSDVLFSALFTRLSDHQISEEFKRLNRPMLVIQLCGQLGLATNNVIVAYFLGTVAVVPFIITQRLSMLANSQIQSIGNATWAALAELHAQGEIARFNHQLINLTKLVAVFSLVLMIPIAVYNPYFVQLWVGAGRFAGWEVNLVASINTVLHCLISLWLWCFIGTGQVTELTSFTIVSAVVNVFVSILATQHIGTVGPLCGSLTTFVLALYWYPKVLNQVFGTSIHQLLKSMCYPMVIGVPYGIVLSLWVNHHPPQNWFELVLQMISSGLGLLGLMCKLVLSVIENSPWHDRVQKLVRRLSLYQIYKE